MAVANLSSNFSTPTLEIFGQIAQLLSRVAALKKGAIAAGRFGPRSPPPDRLSMDGADLPDYEPWHRHRRQRSIDAPVVGNFARWR